MYTVMEDLKLDQLFVIYPGDRNYEIGSNIQVVGFQNLPSILPLIK